MNGEAVLPGTGAPRRRSPLTSAATLRRAQTTSPPPWFDAALAGKLRPLFGATVAMIIGHLAWRVRTFAGHARLID